MSLFKFDYRNSEILIITSYQDEILNVLPSLQL